MKSSNRPLLTLLLIHLLASGAFSLHAQTTFFLGTLGSAGSEDGEFNRPFAIEIDAANEILYVSDEANNRVQALDLDGNFLFKWGEPGTGDGQMNSPTGIAFSAAAGTVQLLGISFFIPSAPFPP
jgi:DNA-binding beta-propeller fold protein YncE